MADVIHRQDHDAIAVLRIDKPKANALDPDLLRALHDAVDGAHRDGAGAIVLTGTGGIFSAGVDLPALLQGGEAYARELLLCLDAAVRQLLECDRPIVAAINGHAIAGGCVLAASCDARVMNREHGRIGVTELPVGVPFPAVALEVIRGLLPPHTASDLVLTGRTMRGDAAADCGLVDAVTAGDAVLDEAMRRAGALAALSPPAFAVTKRQLRAPLLDAIARSQEFESEVHRVWALPDTQTRIRAYLDALKK